MDYSRSPLGKHSRPAISASATSRKNKLQRCSVCGGLGHKSRTCDQQTALKSENDDELSDRLTDSRGRRSSSEDYDDDYEVETDATDLRAAIGAPGALQRPIRRPEPRDARAQTPSLIRPEQQLNYSPPIVEFSYPHWYPYSATHLVMT